MTCRLSCTEIFFTSVELFYSLWDDKNAFMKVFYVRDKRYDLIKSFEIVIKNIRGVLIKKESLKLIKKWNKRSIQFEKIRFVGFMIILNWPQGGSLLNAFYSNDYCLSQQSTNVHLRSKFILIPKLKTIIRNFIVQKRFYIF